MWTPYIPCQEGMAGGVPLVRVRFLSELEKAEGKERAENSEFKDQSRRDSDYTVFKSPYPARTLSNPH